MSANPITGYTVSQRILHWGMALLIFYNLLFTDGIETFNRALHRGPSPTAEQISDANIHAYVGFAILALAVLRLLLRFVQGAPPAPVAEPRVLKWAAKVGTVTFYLLFFAMPLTGIAKYYFDVDLAGDIHADVLKVVLWVLIAAHVAAALVHQFYWKTDVVKRMTRG
ncbi:MAG: cytochrome b [Allorhizobium sp.]